MPWQNCPERIFLSTLNCFQFDKARRVGVFPVGARINHSCQPNSDLRKAKEGITTCVAIKEMSAGEEMTYSYRFAFEGATTEERQQDLDFNCKCNVCTLSPQLRLLSDMRRRLIRGLQVLSGVFGDGKYSAVIIDPVSGNAEKCSKSLSRQNSSTNFSSCCFSNRRGC